MNGGFAIGHLKPDCVPTLARMVKPGQFSRHYALHTCKSVIILAQFSEVKQFSKGSSGMLSELFHPFTHDRGVYTQACVTAFTRYIGTHTLVHSASLMSITIARIRNLLVTSYLLS